MTTTLNKTFRLTALAAALLAAYGTALAQQTLAQEDPEIGRLASPSANSNLSIGIGDWSKDRPFQGQYDGMQEGRSYLLLDGRLDSRDDATGTWFSLDARNLGLDTRELRMDFQRQGDIGGYIDFNQIQRKDPWTINTNLLGLGTPNMTVQATPPAYEAHLGTKRDRTTLGFFKNLNSLVPGLEFKVDFRNEDKSGQQNYSIGSDPLFLVQPVDSRIRQLDVLFQYSKDKVQLTGGYYASWYDNSISQISGLRATPASARPGSAQSPNPTPLSQALSNESWELYLDGGYSFTPSTRGTFKVKYGKATMEEQLPSWSLPPPNDRFLPMPQKLNGRVDTTLVQFGLSSRPMPKLSIVANLRYYDMDDKTPVVGVIGTNPTGPVTVHNTPQSIETTSGKLEVGYRLPQGYNLIGTIDGKSQTRSSPQFPLELYVPYRTKLEETNYRIQLRRNLTDTMNGSIGYVHSDRDGNQYTPTFHPVNFPEDLIRPWNIADRKRDKWRLKLDWTPANNFTLQGVFEDARDKYPHDAGRPYGMTGGSANLFSLDGTLQINPDWQMVAYYAYDSQDADRQHGRWQRTGAQIFEGVKTAQLKDKSDTLGFDLNGKVDSKWKLGANVLWTKSRSSYDETWTPSGLGGDQNRYPGAPDLVPLPNIKTELTRLALYADYAVQKNGSLRFDVIFEDWRTNDWTYSVSDGSPYLYGTTGGSDVDGTFFKQNSPQKSTFIGLRYKYMMD